MRLGSALRAFGLAGLKRLPAAVAVETAIVLPIILVVLIGFVDFGRLFYTQIALKNATDEVARALAYGADRENRFVALQLGFELMKPTFIVAEGGNSFVFNLQADRCPEGVPIDGSEMVRVDLRYEFEWFTPLSLVAGGQNTIGQTSTYTITSQAVCQA